MNHNKIMKHHFLARLCIEAKTPLAVGTGEKDIITDDLVATDTTGLPYIPGTAIAGVLRHAVGEDKAKKFFGFQDIASNDGKGSEIIFSSAHMVGKDGVVIESLTDIDFNDPFYNQFKYLPIRQHCRISSTGTAADGGKFDEQVVFKGSRFCFEIEMVSDGSNFGEFENVLKELHSKTIRFGGGTRNGFGEIEIVDCEFAKIDLSDNTHLIAYLEKSSSLVEENFWKNDFVEKFKFQNICLGYTKYELKLKPDNFFLFASGTGSKTADLTPVTESVIQWNESGKPEIKAECILIPASSVKGAISHRVAFHYNKLTKKFADKEEPEKYVGSNNLAVKTFFGAEGKKNGNKTTGQQKGRVIFSDIVVLNYKIGCKLLSHVSIDRFTGGTIDGALFFEEVFYDKQFEFIFTLFVDNEALKVNNNVKMALEKTLTDICSGLLPLGGGVNRGLGVFTGCVNKNGEELKL